MNDCNSPKYSLSDNDIKDVFLELEKSLFIGAKKKRTILRRRGGNLKATPFMILTSQKSNAA
ncbi:MAG: hypothetical protein IPJ79_15200 [Bacteroidetes bacterium]|nr:hypothetical protein [Bacteroidota bacterium]